MSSLFTAYEFYKLMFGAVDQESQFFDSYCLFLVFQGFITIPVLLQLLMCNIWHFSAGDK